MHQPTLLRFVICCLSFFFFFNDTATTEIYTLSLHDALPICPDVPGNRAEQAVGNPPSLWPDRKSTRLNSSHGSISYAVFCLKKKKSQRQRNRATTAQSVAGFQLYLADHS